MNEICAVTPTMLFFLFDIGFMHNRGSFPFRWRWTDEGRSKRQDQALRLDLPATQIN